MLKCWYLIESVVEGPHCDQLKVSMRLLENGLEGGYMYKFESFSLRRALGVVVFAAAVLTASDFIPVRESAPSVAIAQTEELVFQSRIKRGKKRRRIRLSDCSLFEGSNRVVINSRGNRVRVELRLKRESYKLPVRYGYFACGDNGSGEDSIFAKLTADSEVVEIDLDELDFPKGKASDRKFSAVCKKVRELSSREIYKTLGSTHFSTADCRRRTAGLIIAAGGSDLNESCLEIYDSEGTQLGTMGAYYPSGRDWAYRAYACWGCSSTQKSGGELASQARKNTKKSSIYIRYGGTCIRIPDAGKCYNSKSC